MRERKVPMRRCVGCMTSFPKGDVMRFVVSDDKLIMDKMGRRNGRGAYLCRSLVCFDLAMKKRRLTHALGVNATPDELADLREAYANEVENTDIADAAEVSE